MSAIEATTWKGLRPETMLAAGIHADEDGLTFIPYRLTDGPTFRTRVVAPDGRRWWSDDGQGQLLFGLELEPGFHPELPVLITEGETDCLAARELGWQALGAPGARSFRSEWRAVFERFDVIYAVGDGDAAGRIFAWTVRRCVPWARPVVLPEEADLRELLQSDRCEELEALLAEADYMARLEWAVLTSATLEECESRLRGAT
jgi:hypothetical protein